MPSAPANAAGIELFYETYGDPDGVPLLFVMGLGAQLTAWDIELIEAFVDRGFFAIRFDNRDVGLSTKVDVPDGLDVGALMMAAFSGESIEVPYLLSEMAADSISLLDHLGLDRVHLVGASMGGMIVQAIAIEYPERVLSLTSVMSTTGEHDVGMPDPAVLPVLLNEPATDRESAIAMSVAGSRAIGSPAHFDETIARAKAEAAYDRSYYPAGFGHQLLAIAASGSRADGLRALDVPTLVIHGDVDPLVNVSGGRRTAELVPGAELLVLEGMGHDLPEALRAPVIEAVIANVGRATADAS